MAAVNQISKASQLQSSATQQTAAALNQIEGGARRTRDNGGIANEQVQELDAALKSGRQAITGLIEGVATALQGAQSSVALIKRLQGLGRRIEKIIDAIALVAVQTSMLAVSGAVEAARAGEAGRGFAVVSNDIRVLAREATEQVDRARDTVHGILDQVATLRTELEQSIGATEAEVQNNRAVSAGLVKIEHDVLALSGASRSILDGADSILAAASEMAKASRQVATAAEEASAAAREAATAATQQSRGVEDLAAATEEIAALAEELQPKG
jgi:methyl-accepting chemotaxis protein